MNIAFKHLIIVFLLAFFGSCGNDDKRKSASGSGDPVNSDGTSKSCEDGLFCIQIEPIQLSTGGPSSEMSVKAATYAGAEVTLSLAMTLENLSPSIELPSVFDLKRGDTVELLKLSPVAGTYSYEYKYQFGIGRRDVSHDESVVYRLPFKTGESYVVIQGYHGGFTHKDDDAFAVDFAMPEGTAIHAARSGIVVAIESSYRDGGAEPQFRDKANFVRVLQDDGTIANYLHLRYQGVVVTRGATVNTGDLLGYSGNTGYSTEAHLHFDVSKRLSVDRRNTISIQYKTTSGTIKELQTGTSYTAID